ncbi:hypothetical protein U2F26_11265 [Micromonospora sp. 4G57]|uniref:Adhesin domain-containing protein n=1 Tax=Micromonospora sicca TaxID=2202420 RepID=A0ABU5JKV4_9ACTN|nr:MULTISPECIES: hypothetical protein [unclassified Micromonospora]MDZ5443309.1 hypothetical protein [Micromonospora sp. 4G57]MDZ5493196.1 hypothetical protein [Micromonospora sp. 4G53]
MQEWQVREGERLELPPARRVRIRVVGGEVDLTSGPPLLELTDLNGPPLRVSLTGDLLELRHDQGLHRPWWRDFPPAFRRRCRLALALPAGTEVEVETVGAGIIAVGLSGSTRLTSLNGEIVVDRTGPELRARTVSARILARGCTGHAHLETVSGEVTVVTGREPVALDLAAVSGPLLVGVPDDAGASLDVELTTNGGSVVTQLPDGTPGLESHAPGEGGATVGLRLRRGTAPHAVRVRGTTVSGQVALVRQAGSGTPTPPPAATAPAIGTEEQR